MDAGNSAGDWISGPSVGTPISLLTKKHFQIGEALGNLTAEPNFDEMTAEHLQDGKKTSFWGENPTIEESFRESSQEFFVRQLGLNDD